MKTFLICLALLSFPLHVFADDKQPPKPADYASSSGQSIGDIVRIKSDTRGFQVVGVPDSETTVYCAGYDSELRINGKNNTYTFVEFKDPDEIKNPTAPNIVCKSTDKLVVPGVTYRIANNDFDWIRKKTSGVAFGALVVPFKFRLGSQSKLVSSSTVAPYIGFRFKQLQGGSMEAIPIFAAGLGVVPVTDPTTNKTDTKTAFSTTLGFIITSEKSPNFSAGVVVGKDFMDRDDRGLDSSVSKPWISLWIGVSLK